MGIACLFLEDHKCYVMGGDNTVTDELCKTCVTQSINCKYLVPSVITVKQDGEIVNIGNDIVFTPDTVVVEPKQLLCSMLKMRTDETICNICILKESVGE